MQLLKIAWRNLKRNKVRTSIAVFAITTVVVIVIFSRGLIVGFTESSFSLYINNMYGHVRITTEEYDLREPLLPLDYAIRGLDEGGASEMAETLKQEIDDIQYILPRIRFGAMSSLNDDVVRMMGVGTDMAAEAHHGTLPDDLIEGRMPEEGNEILLGSILAEKLEKGVGERVTFMYSDAYQSMRGRTFEIVGLRESGSADLDEHYFYLPLKTAQDMLWMDDEVTEMLVFGSDAQKADTLQAELDAFLNEHGAEAFTAVTWSNADPFVQVYNEMDEIMFLVYVLFILMGTVVVVSTLSMIVRERTAEIGMMGALGMRSRDIMNVFLLEGVFIGIIGSLLGVILGGAITFYYSLTGLRVEAFAEITGAFDMLMEPVFYIAFTFENLVVSFFLGAAVVALACLYPAYKASKLKPVDALQGRDM